MKKNLGNIIALVIFFSYNLFGYEWHSSISKQDLYINESVYLKYECVFEDNGELYTIDFHPKADEKLFDLTLLKRKETLVDGKKKISFEYVAKVKSTGSIVFDFMADMKKTSLESIVYTSGSRDDDKGDINVIVDKVALTKFKVDVKEGASLIIGDFSIEVDADDKEVKAYEPYHVDVKISGIGNFHDIKAIEYEIDNVKVFSQKPTKKLILTEDGFKGEWNQKFAFIGSSDFRIPGVDISYFDKQTEQVKILHIDSKNIKVLESYTKEELLDAEEEPLKINFDYVYYLLTFLAGFLVAKIKLKRKKLNSKQDLLIKKINATKSLAELNIFLILNNQAKYQDIIREIESESSLSLAQAKRKAIRLET